MGTGEQVSPVEPLYKYDMGAYWAALDQWKQKLRFYFSFFLLSLILIPASLVVPLKPEDDRFILFLMSLFAVGLYIFLLLFVWLHKPRTKKFRRKIEVEFVNANRS